MFFWVFCFQVLIDRFLFSDFLICMALQSTEEIHEPVEMRSEIRVLMSVVVSLSK